MGDRWQALADRDLHFVSRQLQCNLTSVLPAPTTSTSSLRDAAGAAIFDAMHLKDAGVQLSRHRRYEWCLKGSRRHDDVETSHPSAIGVDLVEPGASKLRHSRVENDRQLELRRIRLKGSGDIVFAGIGVVASWKSHSGQIVVLRRGEQFQRVPSQPPRLSNLCASIDDLEAQVLDAKMPPIPDRLDRLRSPAHRAARHRRIVSMTDHAGRKPVSSRAAVTVAATKSTTRQNGGHQRVLATK